jgi:CHAD domain-containing protein
MADKTIDAGITYYCARSVAPYIKTLKKSAQNIRKRKNIEDIHDVRVSSRRIRTCLAIFVDCLPSKKAKSWQNEVRKITSAYGRVRDLDVQIDLVTSIIQSVQDQKLRSGLRRVMLRLRQKREKKQKNTANLTNSILESPVLLEMEAWAESVLANFGQETYKTPELFKLGYKQIQSRLDEFLFYEVFIFDSGRVEELHQMRIAAKRLRYALEVFSDLYDAKTDFAMDTARQTQQYLGEIHDADVWLMFLPKFMEREHQRIIRFYGYSSPFSRIRAGIEYLIENRRKERARLYNQFIKDWQNWKLKEIWLNLRKVIFLTNMEEFLQKPESSSATGDTPLEELPEPPSGNEPENQ